MAIAWQLLVKGKGELGKGYRLFKMAPLHHHFELGSKVEEEIVVRNFWLTTLGLVIIGIALRASD